MGTTMAEPTEALAAMKNAVARSGRKTKVQLPRAFVRLEGARPLLGQLLRGGQGGGVRLRLYLTLVMQTAAAPRSTRARTGASYAALLGLEPMTGPRRVSEAFRWLESRSLISRERRPSRTPEVTMLYPDGSGGEWTRTPSPFIGVPLDFFGKGWILRLSPAAIACYLCLIDMIGGRSDPDGAFMDGFQKRQYDLSDDTWTRGTAELVDVGILRVRELMVGDDEHDRRRRRLYKLLDLSAVAGPTWP